MLTCDHIFLPFLFPSSFLRRQLLPSCFQFNELDREKFSRCLLRVSAQNDSALICLHSMAHEVAFKRSGRWLFFLSGWFLSCRPMVLARYVTALAPVSRPVGPLFSIESWPLSDDLHYGLDLTQKPNRTSFAKQQLTSSTCT